MRFSIQDEYQNNLWKLFHLAVFSTRLGNCSRYLVLLCTNHLGQNLRSELHQKPPIQMALDDEYSHAVCVATNDTYKEAHTVRPLLVLLRVRLRVAPINRLSLTSR